MFTRDHTVLPATHVYPQVEWATPAFTPQPQSVNTLWPELIFHPAEARRTKWPGWLIHPSKMVTHPRTNRARYRVTLLAETNALPLSQGTSVGSVPR